MSRFSKTYGGPRPDHEQKIIDAMLEIIESEPELQGEMPDAAYAVLCSSKAAAEQFVRSAISTSKTSILKRVKGLK